MNQENLFEQDWRNCLRAHYAHVVRERDVINERYRRGELNDEARRRIERELDLREAHLASVRNEDFLED